MSLVNAETGELLTEDEYLEALASRIRSEVRRGREAGVEMLDAYLSIGQCLLEARQTLRTDNAFGAWFRAQEFGFSQQWAHMLRTGAEHEDAVRAAVTTQVVTGGSLNFKKAVKQVSASQGGGRSERSGLSVVRVDDAPPEEEPAVFSAIVIDPPWRYGNTATRGAAEDHYPTMELDELAAMRLPAADDSHLYLWVTNAFIREGFDLMDVWGFNYKTVLTWVKPQIGMGNWFRNSTEHVLFGVRGSLPTRRNDVPTWFKADRTRHSAKPESFYDLVESCSPGPYLEVFARRRRFGWHVRGNEA